MSRLFFSKCSGLHRPLHSSRLSSPVAAVANARFSSVPAQLPLPPGAEGFPLVGETFSFMRNPNKWRQERKAKYGSVFKTHILGSPSVVMLGAEQNLFAFRELGRKLENQWPKGTRALLGENSLPVQVQAQHRRLRQLLRPCFGPAAMKRIAPGLLQLCEATWRRWADTSTQGSPLLALDECKQFTFDIACRLIIGNVSPTEEVQLRKDFSIWLTGLFSLPFQIPGTAFSKAMDARVRMLKLLKRKTQEERLRQDAQDQCNGSDGDGAAGREGLGPSLLSTMVSAVDPESQEQYPVEMIAENLLTLLFTGHDTSSTAATWMIYFLRSVGGSSTPSLSTQGEDAPSFLERLRQEVKECEERLQGDYNDFTFLAELPLLNAAIHEVLRRFPPVGGGFRVALEDIVVNDKYMIPKGYSVLYNITDAAWDEEHFAEPQLFRPERFLEDKDKSAEAMEKAGQFVIFGGGARKCIGKRLAELELRLLLYVALRDGYQWGPIEQTIPEVNFFPIPTPKNKLPFVVTSRSS